MDGSSWRPDQTDGLADPTKIDRVDDRIANYRCRYLKATWAGHVGEAELYEREVDRLLDLRNNLQRKVARP